MASRSNRNAQSARTYNDDIHQTDDYGEEVVSSGRRRTAGGHSNTNGAPSHHAAPAPSTNGNNGTPRYTNTVTTTSDVPQLSRAGPPNGRGGGARGGRGGGRGGVRPHAPDSYSTPATSSSAQPTTRVVTEIIEKRVPAPQDFTGLILSGLMADGVGKNASFSADEKAFIVTGTRAEVARTEKLINQLRDQYIEKRGHELQAKIDSGRNVVLNGKESKSRPQSAPAKKGGKYINDDNKQKKVAAVQTPAATAQSPVKKNKKAAAVAAVAPSPSSATVASAESEAVGAGVVAVSEQVDKKLEIAPELVKFISVRVRQIIAKSRCKVTEERGSNGQPAFFGLQGTRTQVDKAEKQIRRFADEAARKTGGVTSSESKTTATAATKKAPAAAATAAPSKKAATESKTQTGTKDVVAKAEKKKNDKKDKKDGKVATNGESKTPGVAAKKATPAPVAAVKSSPEVSEQPKTKSSEVYVPGDVFKAVVGDKFVELQVISDELHVTMNVTQSDQAGVPTEDRVIVLRGVPGDVNKAKGRLIGRIKYVRTQIRREAAKARAAAAAAAAAAPATVDASVPVAVPSADAA